MCELALIFYKNLSWHIIDLNDFLGESCFEVIGPKGAKMGLK